MRIIEYIILFLSFGLITVHGNPPVDIQVFTKQIKTNQNDTLSIFCSVNEDCQHISPTYFCLYVPVLQTGICLRNNTRNQSTKITSKLTLISLLILFVKFCK